MSVDETQENISSRYKDNKDNGGEKYFKDEKEKDNLFMECIERLAKWYAKTFGDLGSGVILVVLAYLFFSVLGYHNAPLPILQEYQPAIGVVIFLGLLYFYKLAYG